MKAFFAMAGSSIRRVGKLPYPIHLRDIAPTACASIGLPPPANCTGAAVGDILGA
jgi:hypothetical protein